MAFQRLAFLFASVLLVSGFTARSHELPRAVDDAVVVKSAQYVDIDVLANDFTPAGYPTTVIVLTQPSIGLLEKDQSSPGVFRYHAPEVVEGHDGDIYLPDQSG